MYGLDRLGVFVWASFLWSYNTEKKRNICLTLPRPDNFGMCQAFPVKGQEIAQLVWGAQQRSGQKVSTCKAWYLMKLPCSSSRPNPTFSSQPIRLWDRMIRMIQETQETTDHLDFLWNIKTVIHWNLWGWQLGTVRSTSASVGVPGALSCVCHMSHMSYSVFAKRNEIQNFADLRCSKTVKWYFLQCQSGGNIRDDGRIQVWTR